MGLFWLLTFSIWYLSLFNTFTAVTTSLPSQTPQCHEDQSSALLKFKQSFSINSSASHNPLSYPKLSSWVVGEDGNNINCCSWDGVECDELTGNVIGLDLTSSQLQGFINSSSTIFDLVWLQRLSLADNDFKFSQIPSRIGDLSRLEHLNLSQSRFSGEIPSQISQLSKLVSLDLCCNYVEPSSDAPPINLLQIQKPNMRSLIQNSTNLEILSLGYVNISYPLPQTLTNLTSLAILNLTHCELQGEFPTGIFHLSNLRYLDVRFNPDLHGYFPEFHSTSSFKYLGLDGTNFSGSSLPASIGNLNSLEFLSLKSCYFTGSIPRSLSNLTHLTYLDLSYNNIIGNLDSSLSNLTQLRTLKVGNNILTTKNIAWVGKLTRLNQLDLSTINISSELPYSFANLTQLNSLVIQLSDLRGQIPSWIMNLTNLVELKLMSNDLHGEFPRSIFALKNLEQLFLSNNSLTGQLDLSMFLELKKLTTLALSRNKLSLLTETTPFNFTTIPKLKWLELSFCNLKKFPSFLQNQDQLEVLVMSHNGMQGSIPSWIWSNTNLWEFCVSNNSLTGEVSSLACNLKSLEFLELSMNNLSGTLPPCLGSFSSSLKMLDLRSNNFSGSIPQAYIKGNSLQMIDLSQNNLQGQLPKELANCEILEYLDVSNNHINDSFPFCLGTLPELKVLVLRSNKFHGVLRSTRTSTSFPKLHILDLSHNEFNGNLPAEVIQSWKSMMASTTTNQLQYERWHHYSKFTGIYSELNYLYVFKIINKGKVMVYEKLQKVYNLIAIDLSSNKFEGEIPQVIGDLNELVLLNLSNNKLTGPIPSSMGKLLNLESLDISNNSLSGEIPQTLTELTFLETFNVSFNHLEGHIPENNQFSTFQSNSYMGNQGLCGNPLAKVCGDDSGSSPSTSDEDEDTESLLEFAWKVILIGFAGGFVVGGVIGSTFNLEKHAWLTRVIKRWQPQK